MQLCSGRGICVVAPSDSARAAVCQCDNGWIGTGEVMDRSLDDCNGSISAYVTLNYIGIVMAALTLVYAACVMVTLCRRELRVVYVVSPAIGDAPPPPAAGGVGVKAVYDSTRTATHTPKRIVVLCRALHTVTQNAAVRRAATFTPLPIFHLAIAIIRVMTPSVTVCRHVRIAVLLGLICLWYWMAGSRMAMYLVRTSTTPITSMGGWHGATMAITRNRRIMATSMIAGVMQCMLIIGVHITCSIGHAEWQDLIFTLWFIVSALLSLNMCWIMVSHLTAVIKQIGNASQRYGGGQTMMVVVFALLQMK